MYFWKNIWRFGRGMYSTDKNYSPTDKGLLKEIAIVKSLGKHSEQAAENMGGRL